MCFKIIQHAPLIVEQEGKLSKREEEIVRGKIGGQKKKNSRNLVREKRMIVRGERKKDGWLRVLSVLTVSTFY